MTFPRHLVLRTSSLALLCLTLRTVHAGTAASPGRDYPVQPVPFTAVHLHDAFWAPRIETNRLVTIPFAFQQCEKSGRRDNFVRAALALRGEALTNSKPPPFPFDDSDPYKVLEGASYALAVQPDPGLSAYVDKLIAEIGRAQEPDGYLYTARTINPAHPHDWSGPERWLKDPDDSHELYNAGHLFEAAAAHYQATGETNLLQIAIKEANLLCRTFGPQKLHVWPGHEIVEMGLAKLYRVTGDARYLQLAKFFIDVRGPGGDDYHQSRIKPVEQREAVGHAVRAGYLYSGMADVAALTGDETYVRAIDAIWQDVVAKKLYITGGIGARGAGEAFGDDYELPNLTAYCETCAAVANAYWNLRLFLLHGDAKYVDVMERTLYNGVLSGVSLDGTRFFYPNPLESDGRHQRSPWFGVACCPGNITRFLASVPGYVYARQGQTIYVNLYASGEAGITLEDGRTVKVTQQTRYPWDGAVHLAVDPAKKGKFTIKLRIPGWARNEAVPSDLYEVHTPAVPPVSLKVNGKPVVATLSKGYATLERTWKKGDTVDLDLPMTVQRVRANDHVADDQGKVCLERGPIVYCVEWPDVKEGHVVNLLLPDSETLTSEFRPGFLGGVEVVQGDGFSLRYSDAQKHIAKDKVRLTAIPYYAWANRGRGEMAVWLARTEATARPLPYPTIASLSKATASGGELRPDVKALNDQREPRSSGDQANRFLHWWPHKGTQEWVQYDFAKPTRVSATEVYWFDDTGIGECRIPQSWQLLYRTNGEWKPVLNPSHYGCEKDRYNRTTFTPVETDGLRLEVQLAPNVSAGIHEWRVEGVEAAPQRRNSSDNRNNGVYKSRLVPHWFQNNTRFWYRNDLPKDTKEFIVVDAEKGSREPAFDHARLAAALSSASGENCEADKLPFAEFQALEGGKLIQFESLGKTWRCDLQGYECSLTDTNAQAALQAPRPATNDSAVADRANQRRRDRKAREGGTGVEVDSPNGKWKAFIRDHNLFVRSEHDKKNYALTQDGEAGNAYESFEWAPDSQELVAWRVEPGDHKEVYLIQSSPPGGGRALLKTRPYALPGDKFTFYELNVFDLAIMKHLKPKVERFEHEWESPRLHWFPDGRRFAYEQEDRGHQRLRLLEVDSRTGAVRNLIEEKTDTFIWTAHTENLNINYFNWLEQSEEMIYVSERDGWRHLYLLDAREKRIRNQITQGPYVVRGIDFIDERARQIWFHASGRNPDQDPYFIQYYRVNFDGTGLVALTEGNGNHNLQFSPDRKYAIDTYSRVDLAPVHELRRCSDGSRVCALEQADISELLAEGWQPPEVFTAKGRDGKTDIWGIIHRPRRLDPAKKYPVLEQIYAGPQGSYVPKSFSAGHRFDSLTGLGFIVAQIDGMGTANRSKAFHDVCWHNLKDAGLPDRILWHKALAAKHPWYDISRVGIYGTSAGGQSAAGALLFHPEFYKAAVANSGCHDNRMDKASWNEQWMGYPVGPQYAESSNIENAAKLRGHLMLVVGELDENVPPESTYRFVDALVRAGKDFDFLVIPNGGHGAGGEYGERRLEDFFVRNLQGIEPPNRNDIPSSTEIYPASN